MKKKAFIIHPVRGISEEYAEKIREQIAFLRQEYDIYDPSIDTDQSDPIGLNICKQNRKAIEEADIVIIMWDSKSQGCLFDIGMAFALRKEIRIVDGYFPSLYNQPAGKSFVRMIWAWEAEQNAGEVKE